MPSAQTTYVYANDGKTLLTTFYEEHRRPTKLADMSPFIKQAIVASEDTRFYEHNGVDAKGVARAFVANQQAGGVSQGASTLTMQYVRMALRDGAKTPKQALEATEQTTARKLREMRLAIELEKRISKARDPGALPQLGLLRPPRVRDLRGRRGVLLQEAEEPDADRGGAAGRAGQGTLGVRPGDQRPDRGHRPAQLRHRPDAQDQRDQPGPGRDGEEVPKIKLKLTAPPNDCVSVSKKHNDWGFFCDYLRNWWMEQPAFGRTARERLETLRRGGYKVVTTIDPKIQKSAMKHVLDKEKKKSVYAHGEVVIEPGTGRIKAMAVNRRYALDQDDNGEHSDWRKRDDFKGNYPNTVNPLLGGGDMAGYQAGSTFKIFTMLAALEEGMPLDTAFNAPQRYVSKYITAPGPSTCGEHWCPKNSTASMTGRQTMWSGFGKSVNTYFVQLEERVGADKAVRMAERLGLNWRTEVDRTLAAPDHAAGWGAFTLGVSDVTPIEMANVFATLAAEGKYCEPIPVRMINTRDGASLSFRGQEGRGPPLPPGAAARGRPGGDGRGPVRHRLWRREGRLRRLGDLPHGARDPAPAGRRQERHDGQQPQRVVLRVHSPARGGGLRGRPGQPEEHRGHEPGHDLEIHRRRDPQGRPGGPAEAEVQPATGRAGARHHGVTGQRTEGGERQRGLRPARATAWSRSSASPSSSTTGPNVPGVPSRGPWDRNSISGSSSRGSAAYSWPVARARSQPCMISSLTATMPITVAGSVTPPARAVPSQAEGTRQAMASSSRTTGSRLRQCADSRAADGGGGGPSMPGRSDLFCATWVKAADRPIR